MDRYEEALAKARKLYDDCVQADNPIQAQRYADIFPELKESEDERIRKWLIGFMKDEIHELTTEGVKRAKKAIAWLEKQKVNPFSGVGFDFNGHHYGMCARDGGAEILVDGEIVFSTTNDVSRTAEGGEDLEKAAEEYEHNLGYYECVNQWPSVAFKAGAKWQEKQDQETIELAEDHAMLAGKMQMKEEMEKRWLEDRDGCFWDGVQEGKKAAQEQKEHDMPDSTELIAKWEEVKAKLKEKDFRGDQWRLAQNAFMFGFSYGLHVKQKEQKPYASETMNEKDKIDECFTKMMQKEQKSAEIAPNQFDGITYGMQGYSTEKPVEWSEEDEDAIAQAIIALENMDEHDGSCYAGHYVPFGEAAKRLKSLRPQPHWKASVEQMAALKHAVNEDFGVVDLDALDSLYNDLKKL